MHRRDKLADLFWPQLAADAALLNLRQTVHHLRHMLLAATGQELLVANRFSLGFDAKCAHRIDAAELTAHPPRCPEPEPERCDACLAQMAELASSYRGPISGFICAAGLPGL